MSKTGYLYMASACTEMAQAVLCLNMDDIRHGS